jgi:hypothetical protein
VTERIRSDWRLSWHPELRQIGARGFAIDDKGLLMVFFGFSFMPDQMHSYAQCVLLIFKGVARCAGAAFRPMPHQSPTSGASSVPRAIRTNAAPDCVMTRPPLGCRCVRPHWPSMSVSSQYRFRIACCISVGSQTADLNSNRSFHFTSGVWASCGRPVLISEIGS